MIGRVRESRNPKKVIRVTLRESYGEIGQVPVNLYGIVIVCLAVIILTLASINEKTQNISNSISRKTFSFFWRIQLEQKPIKTMMVRVTQ